MKVYDEKKQQIEEGLKTHTIKSLSLVIGIPKATINNYIKRHGLQRKKYLGHCPICETNFESENPNKRYCSKRCNKIDGKRRDRKKNGIEINRRKKEQKRAKRQEWIKNNQAQCKFCNNSFTKTNSVNEFCSYGCKIKWQRKQTLIIKQCQYCKKEFLSTPKRKFCSEECCKYNNSRIKDSKREFSKTKTIRICKGCRTEFLHCFADCCSKECNSIWCYSKKKEQKECTKKGCNIDKLENSQLFCYQHWLERIADRYLKDKTKWIDLARIAQEQEYKCIYSDETLIPALNMSLDHIKPLSKFPTASGVDNLQWITFDMNSRKFNCSHKEFVSICSGVYNRSIGATNKVIALEDSNIYGAKGIAGKMMQKLKSNGHKCPYTGMLLKLDKNISIDHKIPKSKMIKGQDYPDNLWPIHWKINMMKNNQTHEEFLSMCKHIFYKFCKQPDSTFIVKPDLT